MRIPVLERCLLAPMWRGKPVFHRKTSERKCGENRDYSLVRENYEWDLPFSQQLTIYRVYKKETGVEVGYALGFPLLKMRGKKFYIKRLKTKTSNNGFLLNLKSLERLLVRDVFNDDYDSVVAFACKRLIRHLNRNLGYQRADCEGILSSIASKLGLGEFMMKRKAK